MSDSGEQVTGAANKGVPWLLVLSALGLSLAATAFCGGPLLLWQQNVWWLALVGVLSLLGSGYYLGRSSGVAEPLFGALLAIFYFGVVVAILFGGTLTEVLPEPLPGLGVGDSTFFFVWPLLQLVAAVAGSIVGGLQVPSGKQELHER